MKNIRKDIGKRLKKLDRNIVLAGSLTIVLVISAIVALSVSSSDPEEQSETAETNEVVEIETADPLVATVTTREGVVEFRTDGIWDEVAQDLEIETGMSLKTVGASSRAAITFADGSVVRIGPSSEIRFATLTTSRIVIEHNEGNLYNRINPSEGRDFVIQTRNAQFQSVGTAFRTIANGDEEAVEVYQSSVRETTTNVTTNEGEKLTIKSNVDPSKDGQTESIDIEQLKADSFIAWNRGLDQQSDLFKDSLGFLADFDGPEIRVADPAADSTIEVSASASEGSVVINGSTERGAQVTVQSKSQTGSSPVDVTIDGNGNFNTPTLNAPLGTSVFEFVATDRVGNKTTLNVNYTFSRKTAVQQQNISLTVDDSDPDELKFGWILEGMTTPDGVRFVYSKATGPTYPDDAREWVKSGNTTDLNVSQLQDGETYYFRVCRYIDSSDNCDIYSNQVSFEVPED